MLLLELPKHSPGWAIKTSKAAADEHGAKHRLKTVQFLVEKWQNETMWHVAEHIPIRTPANKKQFHRDNVTTNVTLLEIQ